MFYVLKPQKNIKLHEYEIVFGCLSKIIWIYGQHTTPFRLNYLTIQFKIINIH